MLTFNDLLALEGIDTAKVRLVRHQDVRLGAGRLYGAWRNDRDAFEDYQSVQSSDVFPVGDLLASFIVTEARKTVFVGMYRVDGVGTCPPGSVDALLKHDVSGQFRYDLQLGRGPGRLPGHGRHRLGRRNAELGSASREPAEASDRDRAAVRAPLPRASVCSSARSTRYPVSRTAGSRCSAASRACTCWSTSTPASSTSVRPRAQTASLAAGWTTQPAVMAVTWRSRPRRATAARNYQVSVLEVVDENTPDETIEQIESYWKNKLLSRRFGLNRN